MRSLVCSSLFGALLLAALPASADPLKVPASIEVPAKVGPHQLVRCKINAADPKATVIWRVNPSKDVQRATNPRGVFEWVAPPGTYVVEALVIRNGADGSHEVDEYSATVEVERCCEKVPPAPIDPKQPDPKTPAPKAKADPWNALGRIQFGSAGCTATVVHPRRPDGKWDILTANHCIDHVGIGARGTMQLRGRSDRFTVRVVAADAKSDAAWLVTDSADLGDLPFAYLAEKPAERGVKIWHGGFGVDTPGNREEGSVTNPADSNGQTELFLSVSSGDSGGGMFREDNGELISTVCCTTSRGNKARVWGANVDSIRRLRPKSAANTAGEEWKPLELPLRGERDDAHSRFDWNPVEIPVRTASEEWTPVDIPVRAAKAFGALKQGK